MYSNIGEEREKAEKFAMQMPHSFQSRENLLTTIYTGDKKHKQIRQNIYFSIEELHNNMKFIIHYPLDNGNNPYTTEERIILHKKFIEILNIIFDDRNFGDFSYMLEESHRYIASCSMELGKFENAVENLKLASEYAIKRDEEYNPEQEYTSLFLRGMTLGDILSIPSSPNNNSKALLGIIQTGGFDSILGWEEVKEIVENLKKHAKKR